MGYVNAALKKLEGTERVSPPHTADSLDRFRRLSTYGWRDGG